MRLLPLFLLLVAASLTACVQVPVIKDTKVSNLAVTSVWDIPTKFPVGAKYSISPQHLKKVLNKKGEIKNAYQRYADAIKANFDEHGFQEATNADTAEFYVRFVLALSEDLDDKTISEKLVLHQGYRKAKSLIRAVFWWRLVMQKLGNEYGMALFKGLFKKRLRSKKEKSVDVMCLIWC